MAHRPGLAEFGTGTRIDRLRIGIRFTVGVYERSVPMLKACQEQPPVMMRSGRG
jgi:hypothetical protein